MTGTPGIVDRLYHGNHVVAARFRFALLLVDVLTIGFFVAQSVAGFETALTLTLDTIIAVYIAADLTARASIERRRLRFLLRPTTLADLVVVASLVAAPFVESLLFLRVLRAVRLLRSYHMARDLRRIYPFFRRNEDVILATINLVVFVYVVAALVLVVQVRVNPQISNYLDALYFTVGTLTTTGFGDIVMTGDAGRLLAVVIMIVGVALFVRLLQTVFRPDQVKHRCPDCGLTEHDRDAVHCKHCGRVIDIETPGL